MGEAVYHAWSEKAFVTNIFEVRYASFASFFGIPYWIFGIIWFPLVLLAGLWTTNMGRTDLGKGLLILLTIGNIFTGYLWFLDIIIIKTYTLQYIALYLTNYALTALVVIRNWSSDIMHGYVYGTGTGALVGLLFGPYGVAACGIAGGVFGAARNYVVPKEALTPSSRGAVKERLEEEKLHLQRRLKEIEAKLKEEGA